MIGHTGRCTCPLDSTGVVENHLPVILLPVSFGCDVSNDEENHFASCIKFGVLKSAKQPAC